MAEFKSYILAVSLRLGEVDRHKLLYPKNG